MRFYYAQLSRATNFQMRLVNAACSVTARKRVFLSVYRLDHLGGCAAGSVWYWSALQKTSKALCFAIGEGRSLPKLSWKLLCSLTLIHPRLTLSHHIAFNISRSHPHSLFLSHIHTSRALLLSLFLFFILACKPFPFCFFLFPCGTLLW